MVEMEKPKWTFSDELLVINFYENHRILWDKNTVPAIGSTKSERAELLKKLSGLLEDKFSVDEIKKRFNSMRTNQKTTYKKVTESTSAYKPKFRHYDAMMFLVHPAKPVTPKVLGNNAVGRVERSHGVDPLLTPAAKPVTPKVLGNNAVGRVERSHGVDPLLTPAAKPVTPKVLGNNAVGRVERSHGVDPLLTPAAKPVTPKVLGNNAVGRVERFHGVDPLLTPAAKPVTPKVIGNDNNAVGRVERSHGVDPLLTPASQGAVKKVSLSEEPTKKRMGVDDVLPDIPENEPEAKDRWSIFVTELTLALTEIDPGNRHNAQKEMLDTLWKYNRDNPNKNQ